MGVTIFYRGKLRTPEDVFPLTEEVREICEINQWKCKTWDEPWSRQATNDDPPFRGVSFKLHERSESFVFLFDRQGILVSPTEMFLDAPGEEGDLCRWSWAKTQFAGVDTHIGSVKLLVYLQQKYFSFFEITDDGGYYPDFDEKTLRDRMLFVDKTISLLDAAAANSDFVVSEENSLARNIGDLLKSVFGNRDFRIITRVIRKKRGSKTDDD